MKPNRDLIELLADAEWHNGREVASSLGIDREAVAEQIDALREVGVEVRETPEADYRLPRPIVLLDAQTISSALPTEMQQRLESIQVFRTTQSTNAWLLQRDLPPPGRITACLAEFQSGGRGRRGRKWIAPFGSGVLLSVGWRMPVVTPNISSLSLAVAAAARRALLDCDFHNIELKWPNDLLYQDAKVAGILAELRGEVRGPAHVVVGIGLNVDLGQTAQANLTQSATREVTDLATIQGDTRPNRNLIAAALINRIAAALALFSDSGFGPFMADWHEADALSGREIILQNGAETWVGRSMGVEADGALLLDVDGFPQRFVVGEATLSGPG